MLFQNREANEELEHLMSQFSKNPSNVLLKSVCRLRIAADVPVILQLQVVRYHNLLFNKTSVFRQIHEKVNEEDNHASGRESPG